jgi:hypothetical protein
VDDDPGLTWGYCIRCTNYVRGRPVAMIEDRAEAVDGHKGCPNPPQVQGGATQADGAASR